jgi:replicative DNA helicase
VSDVAGIVLYSILENPEEVLDIWPRLKLQYFNSSYSEIFASITKYYNKFEALPSFLSLEMTVRDSNIGKKIKALSLLEVSDDIDIHIAVEALIDQFTQEEILNGLDNYVDKITHYDSSESILKLSEFVMHMEDLVDHSEEIVLMDELFLMDEEELHRRVPLMLNNTLDAISGGMELTNLVMVGGHRGSGKSLTACNIVCNQYNRGDISLFFTIEMRAKEINQRIMSILSGVSNTAIKNQSCTAQELEAVASIRKDFFVDSEEVYNDFLEHKDYRKFEIDLVKAKRLKEDNQIIIVDNHAMTLSDIDLNIQKFKTKYGDKLKTVVVDHVNEIVVTDKYDWKSQIALSKKLKDFAAKYDILMVTPYQTDKTGEARFAKGLLDSADVAINLVNNTEYITFSSTKTRGMQAFEFNAPIDWTSLKISPEDAIVKEKDESKESVKENIE